MSYEDKNIKFGDNLRTAYKSAKISQEKLAKEIGVHKRTLQKYLSNKTYPDLKPAININKTLGVSLDYLFSEETIVYKGEMDLDVYRKLRELFSKAEPEKLACAEIFLDYLLSQEEDDE